MRDGYFITGRGCGSSTKIRYLDYIPKDLDKHTCTFINLKNSEPPSCDVDSCPNKPNILTISKNQILQVYEKWGPMFKIAFDITVDVIPTFYSNVLFAGLQCKCTLNSFFIGRGGGMQKL